MSLIISKDLSSTFIYVNNCPAEALRRYEVLRELFKATQRLRSVSTNVINPHSFLTLSN